MCGANIRPQQGKVFVDCDFCGCTMAFENDVSTNTYDMAQAVFAYWHADGYYYPAAIVETYEHHAKVLFSMDGIEATVAKEHIVDTQEAFRTFRFEGDWQKEGYFYSGQITSHNPLIMHYDDGYTEQIKMLQLRGKRLS